MVKKRLIKFVLTTDLPEGEPLKPIKVKKVVKKTLTASKANPEESRRELINQKQLKEAKRELRKTILLLCKRSLMLRLLKKKNWKKSELKKKPSEAKNQRNMMRKKWLDMLSLLKRFNNSLASLLLGSSVNQLQLKEKKEPLKVSQLMVRLVK